MRGCVPTLGRCEKLGAWGLRSTCGHPGSGSVQSLWSLCPWVSAGPSISISQDSWASSAWGVGPLFLRVVVHLCGQAGPASDGPGGRLFGHVCAVGSGSGVD